MPPAEDGEGKLGTGTDSMGLRFALVDTCTHQIETYGTAFEYSGGENNIYR